MSDRSAKRSYLALVTRAVLKKWYFSQYVAGSPIATQLFPGGSSALSSLAAHVEAVALLAAFAIALSSCALIWCNSAAYHYLAIALTTTEVYDLLFSSIHSCKGTSLKVSGRTSLESVSQ